LGSSAPKIYRINFRHPRPVSAKTVFGHTAFPSSAMMCQVFLKAEIPASMKAFVMAPTPAPVVGAYIVFACAAMAVYHFVAEQEYSSILTMSVIVQCFGSALLCIQVLSRGSAAGISANSLKLEVLAVGFRLSSTVWLNGYLPMDKSGDHVYQITDMVTLSMLLFLLHYTLVVKRGTYQASEDSCSIAPMVFVSFLLAALLHADMDDNPLFDTLWMVGLFCGVVAVLPHLWMIMQSGGHAEALTSHYIMAMAVSRVLSGLFMWEARVDITSKHWVTGFEHGIYTILLAHVTHLIFLVDFAYYYAQAVSSGGLGAHVDVGPKMVCV